MIESNVTWAKLSCLSTAAVNYLSCSSSLSCSLSYTHRVTFLVWGSLVLLCQKIEETLHSSERLLLPDYQLNWETSHYRFEHFKDLWRLQFINIVSGYCILLVVESSQALQSNNYCYRLTATQCTRSLWSISYPISFILYGYMYNHMLY